MGGPAYHVSLLSGRLDPARYETLLVTGKVGPGEESLVDLASRYGATVEMVPTFGPELRPLADVRAFLAIWRAAREFRPDIIHTHTAKAGMLGRAAAVLTRPRPVVVHTFHGHVLEGYFGRAISDCFRRLERILARASDCLIGVSQATVDDLVRLGVAPAHKFRVVRLGLDLDPYLALEGRGEKFRQELGVSDEDVLCLFVGRFVPIKRLDGMLRAIARARSLGAPVQLALVGDGLIRPELERLAEDLGIQKSVHFAGYRRELESVLDGVDVGVLSSDNEGTPVSLIEAAAAGKPLAATRVGGTAEVVPEGAGLLVPAGDYDRLGEAIAELAADRSQRERFGSAAREHVRARYGAERLIADVDDLYEDLLRRYGRRVGGSVPAGSLR
jgi:glycosyltransferase involved in cell wall biosynthesis